MSHLPRFSKLKSAAYSYVWSRDVEHLLPQHYKDRCIKFMTREPPAVHWQPISGRWKIDPKSGQRIPVQNVPIRVIYPEESNKGLWGGEGIIQGLLKKKPQTRRLPKLWMPYLQKRALYSEILDKWFAITVTLRTLDQIDEANGFDHYILKTDERDLNSKLAMDMKREMLLTLVRGTMYSDDTDKKQKIHNRYKEYMIPVSMFR
ncbi:hypothetical protein ScPMuIL_010295 [Solemya velum]